jgi:hypothetical protein
MEQLSVPETRPLAIECLGAIGAAAREAMPELVATALADDWHPNSQAAGNALARIAPGEAVPLLARAFAADVDAGRQELWPSAAALRGAGAAAAPELALFVGALERAEFPTRQNALFVLAGLGAAAMPALPQILAQLDGTAGRRMRARHRTAGSTARDPAVRTALR